MINRVMISQLHTQYILKVHHYIKKEHC